MTHISNSNINPGIDARKAMPTVVTLKKLIKKN